MSDKQWARLVNTKYSDLLYFKKSQIFVETLVEIDKMRRGVRRLTRYNVRAERNASYGADVRRIISPFEPSGCYPL